MTEHHSRRWFQLRLKSLFGLTLLVATFFAGYTLRAKQEAAERRRGEAEAQRQAEELRVRSEAAVEAGPHHSDDVTPPLTIRPLKWVRRDP